MLLSTSSSDYPLPQVPWLKYLGLALLFLLCLAVMLEGGLAVRGYHPTVSDSPEKWIAQRARASALGKRALVLVGASRILLDLDLDALRVATGLEPVQLALDGEAGGPILEGLARDPTIVGTVLVDYYDGAIGIHGQAAGNLQRRYEESVGRSKYFTQPAVLIENQLRVWLKEHLRIYADGANPMTSLRWRLLSGQPSPRYIATLPDRSRIADYTKVNIQEAYYSRVARNLELEKQLDLKSLNVESDLAQRIALITPMDNAQFLSEARKIGGLVSEIQARGGQVIYVAMPSSGMIREIEKRRYPRSAFWDQFLIETGVIGIHSEYESTLQAFRCPDGSHLDARDRTNFTLRLADVLALNRRSVMR